ncbi:hypothetical protein H072_1680 [Dactylellina haptotyla CBS 200.50]|uniref:RNA polymerase II degradation factor 1 n=1 Tax=Dactylellina haptotyla (strain CBS 200.50) TaxID=1284197 RepID=S8ATQ8_DACHA|nr:hypothetical protein H072_1680 [Dactylellina haptotyla CBS 200.50]
MSEITSQRAPIRGRGVSRGGRGGGAIGRGGRNGARSNGDTIDDVPLEDQGELGQLKLKYSSQLSLLKEMFPTWTDEDLINPLEEAFGDAQVAASLISEGHATQWSDVKKKTKEKPKSKGPATAATDDGSRSGRGGFKSGRGGFEGTRGGRGRGATDRGSTRGRGGQAARGGKTNGTAEGAATESSDWPTPDGADDHADTKDPFAEVPTWKSVAASDPTTSLLEKARSVTPAAPMTASEKPAAKSSVPAEPPKKTWASLLHTPAPPPPPPQPTPVTAPKKVQSPVIPKVEQPVPVSIPEPELESGSDAALPPPQEQPTSLPPPVVAPTVKKSPIIPPALPEIATPKLPQPELAAPTTTESSKVTEDPAPETVASEETPATEESLPPPSLDKLTEENLEKIENVAPTPPTSTAASTAATTPIPSHSQANKGLHPMHRGPGLRSGLRRMLDQHEPVVMPRDNPIDRATVQFGSMGLNGDLDDSEEVEQVEKPETVAPPQQSPIGQPKASLPMPIPTATSNIASLGQAPTAQQPQQIPEPQPQAVPIRHAPGLAAPTQPPSHANPLSSSPSAAQHIPQQPSQPHSQSLPRGSGFGSDQSKFDSFGQQPHLSGQQNPVGQSPFGGYQSQNQQQGGNSADPYANYYASGDPARNSAFNTFYNNAYQQGQNQQQGQQQQPSEPASSQPRSSSALGGGVTASAESAQTGATAGSQQQGQQSRFGASFQGNDSAQPGAQANAQQAPQHPSQQYPMHPSYYPYYNYMSMYNHYGGYPKGAFYGASPQGYMSPGGYEHSSSPAGYSGFGAPSSQGRDSTLNEYGRAGSTQAQVQHQGQSQHSNLGYGSGGVPDYMSPRQQSQLGSFGSQQQLGLGGGQQGGHSEDTLKPYGESKAPTGPSGNTAGAPGRPPSTSGLQGQGGQSQLPQNQSHQQQQTPMGAAAGYPHHLQGQSQQHTPLMGGGNVAHQGGQHGSGYGQMYGGFGGSYPQYGSQGGNRQQGGWGYGGH